MSEPLLAILLLTPVIGAAVATIVAWRFIAHRALFAVVALCVLLGLQGAVAPVAIGIFLPGGSGLTAATANRAFVHSVTTGAVFQIAVGSLILWWLARALRKP